MIGSNPVYYYNLANQDRWMIKTSDVNFGSKTIDNDVISNVVFDSYFNKIGLPQYSWNKLVDVLATDYPFVTCTGSLCSFEGNC